MGKLYQLYNKDDPGMTGTFECKCGNKHPVPETPGDGDYLSCFGCGSSYLYSEFRGWEEVDIDDFDFE